MKEFSLRGEVNEWNNFLYPRNVVMKEGKSTDDAKRRIKKANGQPAVSCAEK